ncbi:MAG: chromate transporter [Eubacterium sp.]|nr:chromate transporter [Eubacterium sp.]
MKKESYIWTLFITFFKIGAFTFGGGYAMIPLVQAEIVDKKGWITEEEFINIIAIAEATPGVIAVNTATFVGYKIQKTAGSLFATLGVVLPSFIIIGIISLFFEQFIALKWVNYAFQGIRAGVVILILGAVVRMGKKIPRNAFALVLVLAAFLIASFSGINVVFIILAGALAGIFRQLLIGKNKMEDRP